ncbi:MAG: TIGR01777 family oxidoreductase [Marmoricola sp.]
MHVLVAGSSGFLGTHLTQRLEHDGHTVTPLVRRTPQAGQRQWDPYAGPLDPATLEDVDVVVNLAGSPTLGNPHSSSWARELEHSRVTTTRVLADAIAASDRRPAFLAGNGISYYGDHGDDRLDESADSRGDALLTRVTRHWQAATAPASEAGARVAVIRTAPVLDASSAPLKQLKLLFSTGLGGRLGSGRQYFPVISLRDWVGGVAHLSTSTLDGPVNLCAPEVPTNAEFTAALGSALHRPTLAPVPAAAIRLAAGPMAPEVLNSVRGVPQALLEDGYTFADPDISAVLATGLA